ncbi:hypothetical protein HF888_12240 [Bermanella marisrubri]|nr:hypothetical protein [Bermanella marisrubri]QIZ84941.1 hypothetical protein HF888_12240 [Bermanella marisrubri]
MNFILILIIIATIVGALYWFQNRNREKVVVADHDFFSRLWLWPKGEHTRWEAEYDLISKYSNGTIGLHAEDNYETLSDAEPTIEEVEFSKKYITNLERLFPIVVSGVEEGWFEWFREELPKEWESHFIVDGFSVPLNGNIENKWSVNLFCKKAGHYFCLNVEGGVSTLESIDG